MIEFIDTHTHLFEPEFNEDRDAAVQRALDAGVRTLCLPCINYGSIERVQNMCSRYAGTCYGMVGLHPTEVGDGYLAVLDKMYSLLKNDNSVIAIGEVGLDFYWDDKHRKEQIDAFSCQIDWAEETGLPLAIHSRSAFEELYATMDSRRGKGLGGVFHCFSGTAEEAKKLLSFDGFYLGIGGVLTYKNSTLPQALKDVPLERIVLETDSPYLSPVPHRGKRNESAYIPCVAAALATLYGTSIEEVARVTTANARRLFPKLQNNGF